MPLHMSYCIGGKAELYKLEKYTLNARTNSTGMQPGFCLRAPRVGVLEQLALDVDEFAALGTSPWVVRGQRHCSLVL